ncbi:hypothetical protein Q1695_014850 [Nippostrongylus brasiliensis]|nr:hypothetical protein Q1695_014850 [Nippostrongylus brasiliensis]
MRPADAVEGSHEYRESSEQQKYDLHAKTLRGDCLSAADAKIDQDDYMLTATASNTQMWKMGKRPLTELTGYDHCLSAYSVTTLCVDIICDDNANLSHPAEAENFKKATAVYHNLLKEIAECGDAIRGVMTYENVIA